MSGTALTIAEHTDLESQSHAFMAHLNTALDKVHRFYGLKTGKYWLAGWFNAHSTPGLSLKKETSADGHNYMRMRAFMCTNSGNRAIPLPISESFVFAEDRHLDDVQKYCRNNDNIPADYFTQSQINLYALDEKMAADFAAHYGGQITSWISKNEIKIKANKDRLEDIQPLITALILDSDLEPEDFFAGYQRRTENKNNYIALNLDVPNIEDEKILYDTALTKLDDPTGIDLAAFGDDVSMRASRAASIIDD